MSGSARLLLHAASLALAITSGGTLGCADAFPELVPLTPAAANVELVTEPPNPDVYEPAGELTSQVIGRDQSEAFRQAFNHVRNQAAAKGASFVSVDDVTARTAWDFSGRTVVAVVGTAYKPK